ncbi:MAG: peptide ABC transporter substrate-binding protein [Ruminiclostridium sp.]|nr:peptide ABC transporter substrate-binding protein [Ruminiclostridium sp.]
MLKKVIVFLLVVFVMTSVLAGCGAPSSTRESITALMGEEPQTIDPGTNSSVDGGTYILHAFEGLTRVDKDNKTAPGIANKWEISTDGLTYTFHLRNAKWSDGQPVKAQDFEFAWKRALDPATASEYAYQLWYIKNGAEFSAGKAKAEDVGVKAKDDKTLEVLLAAPTPYFIDLMHFPTYMPLRKDIIDKYADQWTQKPETYIGNGPYMMSKWVHDSEIVFVKNPNYWDSANVAAIKEIHWKLMSDDAAALSAFEAGEIDLVDALIPQAEVKNLIDAGTAKVYDLVGTYYIYTNVDKEPLNNPKVRQALSLAIDRQFIVDKVTKAGQKPAEGIVPYKVPGLDATKDFRTEGGSLISKTTQAEEAKKLLAEAGFPDGKGFPELEIYYNTQSGHKAIMEAVMEMWKNTLGITVKSPNMEWKVLQDKVNNKDFVLARMGWIGDYNDPMTFLDMWTSDSSQNNTNWKNAKFDEAIKKAKSTADQKIRMPAMHDAEKIFMEDMPAIPIYYYVSVYLENPKVQGHIIDTLGFLYLQYAYTK